ncbi:MAG: RsmD family RNA methyltransferase [Desulfurococcales archaeon]|nr:RsmD family RNA methyltransferase [Desulfurococcales archaeon]
MLEVYHFEPRGEAVLEPWGEPPPGLPPPPPGMAGGRRILVLERGSWRVAEVRAGHYYKLVPTQPGAPPTLEIDGIHMHRVSGTDPWRDTLSKVAAARVRRGHRVLDVCTGLGYTAIASLRRGASVVHTIEVDENVLWLAERNPWSRGLADHRVAVLLGDASSVVWELPEGFYDRVIHDPPRFTKTSSSLYTLDLYRRLYALLRPGGVLYHYTGEPGRLRGLALPGRVARLLREAGFEGVRWDPRSLGLVARKPRRPPLAPGW